jgi:hypothetical protein
MFALRRFIGIDKVTPIDLKYYCFREIPNVCEVK